MSHFASFFFRCFCRLSTFCTCQLRLAFVFQLCAGVGGADAGGAGGAGDGVCFVGVACLVGVACVVGVVVAVAAAAVAAVGAAAVAAGVVVVAMCRGLKKGLRTAVVFCPKP